MTIIEAHSFRAGKRVPIVNLELVQYKNGRMGVRGDAGEGPQCRVSRIISHADAEALKAEGYEVVILEAKVEAKAE